MLCYVAILLFVGEVARAKTSSLVSEEDDSDEALRNIFMRQLYDKLEKKNAELLGEADKESGIIY